MIQYNKLTLILINNFLFFFAFFLEATLEVNHNSMSSTSEAVLNLTEQKANLMNLKIELAKQELKQSRELHQLKMKHLNEEHDLRMMVLQYECT